MPWQIIHHADTRIIETRYAGMMSEAELSEAMEATLAEAREHGEVRFLGDCTDLLGGHSVGSLYELAKTLEIRGTPHTAREAVVLPRLESTVQEVEFWETTARNRGYDVRVFKSREAALRWLLDPSDSV